MKRFLQVPGKELFGKCLLGAQLLGLVVSTNSALAMSLPRPAPFHLAKPLQSIGQQPVWRTLAGYPGQTGSNDGDGISARFFNPAGIAADSFGNIYVADSGNHLIRKITPAGVVSTIAGQNGVAGWKDGPGTNAFFNSPNSLALGPDGSIYVTDAGNYVLRRISAAGVVSTLAGAVGVSGYRDGTGTNAWFGSSLGGVAVDANGTVYLADPGNCIIRKISSDGVVITWAGQPGTYGYQDGVGTNAFFRSPSGVALDSSGNVFVADGGNNVIRKITASAAVTTWAGKAGTRGYRDGTGTNAWFAGPQDLTADNLGNLYVAETQNRCIRRISPEADVSTLGGVGQFSFSQSFDHVDGIGPFATFGSPRALAIVSSGHLVVADAVGQTIRYGSVGPEPRPEILSQPLGGKFLTGSDVTLSVAANAKVALSYQWLHNGQVIPGATSTVLRLQNLSNTDAGEYRVAVADSASYVLSFPANIAVSVQTAEAHRDSLDSWIWLASAPLRDIHGLAYGSGSYVAVGGGHSASSVSTLAGSIVISTDGNRWVKRPPVTSQTLNGIAFGAGKFVAVGAKGTVLTSDDGWVWEPQMLTAEGLPDLDAITYAQGVFVAVSGSPHGSIWTSSDGATWTNRGLNFGVSFMGVARAGEQFVAVGNTIMSSADGVIWQAAEVPVTYVGQQIRLEHIGSGNSISLASQHSGSSALAFSATGQAWQDRSPTNGLSLGQLTYGNELFLAADGGSGGVSRSKDGISWTVPVLVTNGGQIASYPHLRFDRGLFVASGNQGALFTSSDGQSWDLHQQEHALPFPVQSLVMVEDHYVAGADSGLEISTNASEWSLLLTTNGFPGLAYGNGTLVAVGGNNIILSSPDGGATWTDRSPNLNYVGATPWLSRVVFGGGTFIALGSLNYTNDNQGGHVLVSPNGLQWKKASWTAPAALSEAAYGAGCFDAVLNRPEGTGEIFTSTDGMVWKSAGTYPGRSLNTIAFGNQRFLVGTSRAALLLSSDGTAWREYPLSGGDNFNRIVFGNGMFLALASSGGIFRSADGLTWIRCAAPTANPQNIAATEGRFFMMGDDNSLYQSAPSEWLGKPRWLSTTELEWTITGAPHLDYRVEFTEDFRDWHTLTRFTNAPATQTFTDPLAGLSSGRFYRVVTE